MTTELARTTDQELLNRAHLRPVWDEDGNLVGISELKVETDRRLGIRAMRDLFETTEANDDVVGPHGWTLKQKRIANTPAPKACHYLKPSKRWDARAAEMVQTVTILLPTEVVWTMFDLLFDGQYSIDILAVETTDEEVMPQSEEYKGSEPENMPGRRFFTRARVRITIHLANGQERRFTGAGIAFGDVPMHKIGNIMAINNEMRTTEKGAISDAKREALSQIGPVFRRAFEDGGEMMDEIENMLVRDLRERNRPRVQSASRSDSVPAPGKRPSASQTCGPATKTPDRAPASPAGVPEAAAQAQADARPASGVQDDQPGKDCDTDYIETLDGDRMQTRTDAYLEVFLEQAMGSVETVSELDELVRRNARALSAHVPDRSEIDALRDILVGGEEVPQPEGAENSPVETGGTDGIPDFELAETDSGNGDGTGKDTGSGSGNEAGNGSGDETGGETGNETGDETGDGAGAPRSIEIGNKSGKSVLEEFRALFGAATSAREIDAIVEANGKAIRKLTPKQMNQMVEAKSSALAKLAG